MNAWTLGGAPGGLSGYRLRVILVVLGDLSARLLPPLVRQLASQSWADPLSALMGRRL